MGQYHSCYRQNPRREHEYWSKKSWLVFSSQDFIVYYRKLWVLFLGDGAVLAAVLAVLAVFCFVNDGWFKDFDCVPDACRNYASVVAYCGLEGITVLLLMD